MNCRPGDLAVIVRSEGSGIAGEISRLVVGRICRVVQLRAPKLKSCTYPVVWKFEEPMFVQFGGKKYEVIGAPDEILRPLRDNEGEDETLTWAPRTEPVCF